MAEIFRSPHLIDVIVGFAILEGVWLAVARRRTVRPIAIALMLLPGVLLMLALRAALADAAWPWVPAALAASLVAHMADLRERWRS